ncbi:MAG: nitroreductase family protein [Actinobacteria bacterium HGW-Actinobacteria-7]|jgi:nitroreductase|nr:MAG: nitroreductase family protein [Actinobacteria bacterium HGW-Actinobacteria-7]
MDALEALMSRRSIRNYSDQPVTEDQLETVLRAAMAAPSAGNQQSWRFIVVTDEAQRETLSQATPYSGMISRAPVALVICGDTRAEKHPGYWVQDCSAAIENLLVAAHAIGLGAVWIGVHPVVERADNVRAACGIPEGIEPMSMIALGHPLETKPPSERYEPQYVHRDRWQG